MAIFRRDVFPKGLRTGKEALRGKISPRCMQNQLILARSASYVCLKPGKTQLGEYISRISCPEGPLFLSGALKSCIMSNFCHSFAVPPFARGRTASVVVLGASKRYGRPSRGGASVSLLGGELGKCGPPPPRVEAQALWELVRSCKHHEAYS